MPAEYLKRYFVELESGYRVSKPLREAVLFSPQNLLTDPPFSGLDLVSCRNVLIYLHRDTHDRLFGVFHFALNDGGLLFMGNAESIGSHEALFKTVDRPNHVYQKRSDTSAAANRTGFRSPAHHVLPTGQYRTRTRPNTSAEAATTRTIADVFGPAAIAVDADDKVRYLHGDANRYLALPSGEPRYELSKLLKTGLSARVMAAIRSVRDGHDQFDESVTFREESKWRSVRLVVRPTSTAPGLLMVAFEERGELPASEENIDSSSAEAEIIESLEKELETTRAELSTTVEEMESANEELKASNEEVLSMNEELQSTNEELETSKEEMQSLNEELTTVNSELEDKVTQLEHTNRDLESLLESSDLPILFFDSELRLRRYSERASGAFGLISTDIGRPFDSLPSRLTETVPEGHFAQARFASEPNQAEITDPDGSTFLLRVVPHRDDENNMSGVVATFTDVTELRKARDDLASSLERYRSLAENSTDIIARFDKEHRHLFVNRHIENVVEVATEDFLGKTNRELGFPAELCDLWDNRIDAALRSGQPQHAQFSVEDRYGERRIYDWTVTPEKRQGDQTVLAVAREVTELERARENLEKALADRDVLIRDVHHRVKNNLFLLVGLLMMERQKLTKLLEDPEPVVQSMDKLMARVRVISTIYSYLYESTGEAEWVHARQFVTGLTDLVRAAYAEHPVDLTVHCDDVHLPVDTSIPVGLIINEALTNAYKHAFPDGRSGNITVELVDLEDGKIRLSVEDDGIGFPEDSTQSIGQSLIHTLANQIDGSIEQTTDDGVTITIMFPVPEEEDRGQSYHS
jgi:two-component system CheB/CheR fusion protein